MPKAGNRKLSDAERDEIVRLYTTPIGSDAKMLGIAVIATELERSTATIYKVLRQSGVAIRSQSEGQLRVYNRKPRTLISLHDRLWAKIDKRGPDECWPFTGFRLFGYGRIARGGRSEGIAYAPHVVVVAEETYGPCPPGEQARHLCGNRGCCNPKHLVWGDQSANEHDKRLHGRDNRGDRHGMSKLKATEVSDIRRRSARGETGEQIAERFGVSKSTVNDIVCGRTWSWLP